MWLWAAPAFAGKWDGAVADVEVSQAVAASPEQVHARLLDWATWAAIFPEDCAAEWELPAEQGLGSRARAEWTFGPMFRRVYGEILRDQPGQMVEVEWLGNKGWYTRFTYTPTDAGTAVTLRSPVSRPKFPLTGVYFSRVKPEWERCYQEALVALAELDWASPS